MDEADHKDIFPEECINVGDLEMINTLGMPKDADLSEIIEKYAGPHNEERITGLNFTLARGFGKIKQKDFVAGTAKSLLHKVFRVANSTTCLSMHQVEYLLEQLREWSERINKLPRGWREITGEREKDMGAAERELLALVMSARNACRHCTNSVCQFRAPGAENSYERVKAREKYKAEWHPNL